MKNWVKCKNKEEEEFLICTKSEVERSIYYLYKKEENKWVLVSKRKNPSEFYGIIFGE